MEHKCLRLFADFSFLLQNCDKECDFDLISDGKRFTITIGRNWVSYQKTHNK